MKKKLYKCSLLVLLAVIGIYLSGCKKSDSPYYDYTNTVQTFKGTAMDYLKSKPNTFDSLLVVLDRFPFLKDSLTNQQVTLFAPVNENFAASVKYLNQYRKAEGRAPIYLRTGDPEQLLYMLTKYIIRGNKTADTYAATVDGISLNAIGFNYPMHIKAVKANASGFVGGGATTLEYSDMYGSTIQTNWVTTNTNAINIKTNNATINILTPLHNFGFDEFTYRLDQ
ncbi:hypothetical protein ASE74_13715 [Pedobacter sp. Leaf216]|uniref:hypothetical protein n=1 Tax=Pedobacter sp. Leaf216 TaxID=1735684 RepID=UPI0006FEBCC3|nr:hypothetical protein [Pedobacter sp. Leaf216]KQM78554.1 hypothetical protein ASE74_13715 [Pedobacter sp. Leaf216]